ncbi:hypothetical protein KOW79_013287 [Hemibagrus wyckioides]|uniref:Uncharacterized protein n=1 Tax=Hemibagrus wyckioides TaxID=337641 RepID=A0A9D3SH20_9TELE|nr:hypothetical protein KOW79_013287 [Hemibagrus wyckioides]
MASSRPLMTLRPPASGPPAQGGISRAGAQLISGPTWRLVGLDLWTMSSVVTPLSDWSRLTGHGYMEPQHNEDRAGHADISTFEAVGMESDPSQSVPFGVI